MANVPYSDLYDHLLPYLPAMETPMADFHIRKMCRDFLRRTTLWRELLPVINTVIGTSSYALTASDTTSEVCAVLNVSLGTATNNVAELPVASESLRSAASTYQSNAQPTGWYVTNPKVVRLIAPPDAVYLLRVETSLTLVLTPATKMIPDFLSTTYIDPVTAGILTSAMMMPKKPWTQLDVGRMYYSRYAQATNAIRAVLRGGGRPNSGTFRGPLFGT